MRDRILGERKRPWPEGKARVCPSCGARKLRGVSDLVREVDGEGVVWVFANLQGGRCGSCGIEALEAYEQIAIEERAGTAFRGVVEGSVTTLGGNKLGTYWPKDIAAALGLRPKDALRMTALDDDTVVVRVVHGTT